MTSEPEANGRASRVYHLPDLLAEIADVAGLPAALAIAQVRGGTRSHFPSSCPDDHWLVATVGRAAADKLCDHFRVNHKGGVSLQVPLGPTKLYDRARFRALEMRDAGHSIFDTAREIGVSTRIVERWRSEEQKRRAMRAASKVRRANAGGVLLARAYDPVKGGLVSSMAGQPSEPEPSQAAGSVSSPNMPAPPAVDIAALPRLLAEVAGVAGIGAAVVLGTMKGAKVLHVTDHAGRGGELARILGPESGARLAAHYRAKHAGDVEILVPYCPRDVLATVATWATAMREDGCATPDVADWLGLTPAAVDHLCAMMRATEGSGFSFRGDFPYFEPAPEG